MTDARTRPVSLRMSLLDQQLVDRDGLPVGRVDDLVLDVDDGQAPVVTGMLVGSEALGRRLGGWTGRTMTAVSRRLRADDGDGPGTSLQHQRLPMEWLSETDPVLKLSRRIDELPTVASLERWLSRHLVSRIPGGGHAVE